MEQGGEDAVSSGARHGRSSSLVWTWASPNLEFATIFVGAIATLYYGLSLASAVVAVLLGNTLATLFHGVLTTWGPRTGLAQMAISRRVFGQAGNILPAGLNAVLAGIGWFAVNSVSGGLALAALLDLPAVPTVIATSALSLALAFFGHDAIHAFERYAFPFLAVVFLLGVWFVADQAQASWQGEPVPGAFWLAVATSFGYTIAWTPFAADYSRYLPSRQSRAAGSAAALGVWTSTNVLQLAGAASVTAVGLGSWDYDNPTSSYTGLMPSWLGLATLAAIWLGAVCANAINLYSSGLSFGASGLKIKSSRGRAYVVLGAGFTGATVAVVGTGSVHTYESFLLLMGYWIAPWLGVLVADVVMRKGEVTSSTVTGRRALAGPIAMGVGMVASVLFLSNQELYVGPLPNAIPEVGDLTSLAGFALSFSLYLLASRVLGSAPKYSYTSRNLENGGTR
ncbi:purine-cytosine permease family protein [Kineococcus sp. SYSU DK003]|uniref:purine-cytosine permease family protein n=1 Tax=Kineococcus sp. SYSU DK003 TaxID=3383124 RepID=UPI003D7E2A5F